MIDVEVFGAGARRGGSAAAARALTQELPPLEEVRRLCTLVASSAGVHHGHVAIEFVDAQRIAKLNARHRGQPTPTDVLSFPVDGSEPLQTARELGDVIICPEHSVDVHEAIVHGMLHLLGMDHETDGGEMLALQRELLTRVRC
jgi:probable rRNA maturation factor